MDKSIQKNMFKQNRHTFDYRLLNQLITVKKIFYLSIFMVAISLLINPISVSVEGHHNKDNGEARKQAEDKTKKDKESKEQKDKEIKIAFNKYKVAFSEWKIVKETWKTIKSSGDQEKIDETKLLLDDAIKNKKEAWKEFLKAKNS